MREESFKIYVDQLRRRENEKIIRESFSSDFLEIEEEALTFSNIVQVEGRAYLANDELLLQLNVATEAFIPCSICNESVSLPIEIDNFYHSEPLAEIKSGIFDFNQILREAILLEIPFFIECHGGHCPHRAELKGFLKTREPQGKEKNTKGDDLYHPFANLDIELKKGKEKRKE